MKKMILLLAVFLAACAPQHKVSNSMLNGMTVYGIWYGEMYPAETINVARECAIAQTGVYYSREQNLYMIACIIPSAPDSYGIVCMDENAVRSTFGINKDQGNIDDIMKGMGFEK